MPSPIVIVSPKTIAGIPNLIGLITGVGYNSGMTERLAPQRLQYFSSTEISLPQDGQYIEPPVIANSGPTDWP
jgi:hypothetical protein